MTSEREHETIGPYRVIRRLGRGGFGTVYLAEQQVPVRREVAIKLLNPGMDHAEIRGRFEIERETLELMNHPGIAMLLDAGITDDGNSYFAMEYVPGLPIEDYVDQHRPSLRERIELLRRVCDAVQHAHAKGVIHRDLTANNVLVRDVDGVPVPKIIDFGIAKSLGDALRSPARTMDGQVMGTPAYMSPEQARGDIAQIDTRTDIYALGVQLYLLLTGTLPITHEELQEAGVGLLKMICDREPELPSKRVSGSQIRWTTSHSLRGDLDWIVARAMAKVPKERYASAAELSEDLRRYLDHEPVIAGPPTTWYRLSKILRRHRGVVAAGLAVLVTLVAGLIVSLNLYFLADTNADEAQRHLSRFRSLSDVVLLETLREEAKNLGPGRPANREVLQAWVDRAEGLVGRIGTLRLALERGAEVVASEGADEGGEDFLRRELTALIEELEEFEDSPRSPLANVRARLAWADVVRERTLESPRRDWAEASDRVADDPRFAGFSLAAQIGLVPLGPDPVTGLEEFVHLRSGDAPRRDPQGRLLLHEDCGVVFVLVPGGSFLMGSQRQDPEAPRYCAQARLDEAWLARVEGEDTYRPLPVELAPFLLSKYELTQAQWERMTAGEQPSSMQGATYAPYGWSRLSPVEMISWNRAVSVLAEFGMTLPTEARWEYACRAGGEGVWATGDEEASLEGHANFADITAQKANVNWNLFEGVVLEDGYTFTAPVGSLSANALGFHDMHGNVFEMCLERMGPYSPSSISGTDGRRTSVAEGLDERVIRGGDYRLRANLGRCSYRWHTAADAASPDAGVRPAMPLAQ